MVPVSYREKMIVGRSEIIFFLNIFFMVLSIFNPEKIGSHGQSRGKNNRVGRKKQGRSGTGTTGIFFTPNVFTGA